MTADLVANVVISGTLTGLIYGLMALGLSVIFGVVRVVNFAHGEMMTVAMFAAVALFSAWGIDPFLAALPIAAAFFLLGYALQATIINPFITRPDYMQFMLLVAVAIIIVNVLLMLFGPDARNVQVDYQLESIEIGPLLVDVAPVRRGHRARRGRRPVRVLPLLAHRQGDPRLRRQLPRRQGGGLERQALLRAHVRPRFGLRRVAVHMVLLMDVSPPLARITPCSRS
jgi:hypothetical protein